MVLKAAPRHFMAMRCLHAVWLGGCIVEAAWRQQGPGLMISLAALVILVLGQSLRFAAMSALASSWTVRILTAGDAACDPRHIRYIRHPNYVWYSSHGLPAIFGGWITAVVCSIANGVILCIRIRQKRLPWKQPVATSRPLHTPGVFFCVHPESGEHDIRQRWQYSTANRGYPAALRNTASPVASQARLQEDLGLDSMGLITLALEIENHWQLYLAEPPRRCRQTLGELVALVAQRLREQHHRDV